MFCPKCGLEIPDGSKFCTRCGAALLSTQQASAQPETGSSAMNHNNQPYQPDAMKYPMNWYKFLIYFALFASAVLNAISGIIYMTGGQYEGYASMVYAFYGSLKTLDIIMGILCIAVAVFAILTRFSLAKFQVNGPRNLYVLYIVNFCLVLIYAIAIGAITGINVFTASIVANLITSIVMVVVNYIYFNKRKELFVN